MREGDYYGGWWYNRDPEGKVAYQKENRICYIRMLDLGHSPKVLSKAFQIL